MSRPERASIAEVDGECSARFAAVRAAFAANFAAGREVGASFAATVDGEPVVDLWGGWADAACTRPWTRDTIVNVFSTTKAMTALAAHVCVERKLLDVAAPVARYWPEFAAAGKRDLPVGWLLCHQAGLAAIRQPLPLEAVYDWERMVEALGAEAPWWEPGRTSGYHALTFGWLVGELIRRVDGRMPGRFFREEIAEPLGADFHIGLPADAHARVAELVPATPEEVAASGPRAAVAPESLLGKVLGNPPIVPEVANRPEWRAAEIPAANGHGNARAVARVMAALA
ncbi:MAG TPA: serine hydrolase domain-containing protein, partial [Candidatus Binatia bacterium]|nr:serine hydrolase domain-containing protein [Candidatus Binatia bacterium]